MAHRLDQSTRAIPRGVYKARFFPNQTYKADKGDHGGTVVKVLCYKSVDRWFDPRFFIFH